MRLLLPLLVLASACRTPAKELDTGASTSTPPVDADGDGYVAADDCDDDNASIHPGADEACDGLDNDCDGQVDEDVQSTWYADADGDGYGDPGAESLACGQPSGFVADATDCDDGDADVHPDAAERCDGVDDDCDGQVDEDVQSTWYADVDGDGYGDAGAPLESCDPPSGYVADATDCDDAAAAVNPGAVEVCDGVDDDCDGLVDDDDPGVTGTSSWYADGDADGYGDAGSATESCDQPSGTVTDATDCDDAAAGVNPGAVEVCDGVDDDCDGLVDDDDPGVTGTSSWYADGDADGYGDAGSATESCDQPSGTVTDATDCDDAAAGVNPGAVEVCDGVDDDCDGLVDDDDPGVTGTSSWYADGDADGYGDAGSVTESCEQPSGTVTDATDCDDADADINPDAEEVCDGVDDDCDGSVSWLEDDDDGDGVRACDQAIWLRTDSETNNDPNTAGAYGSSEAAALLSAQGVDWTSSDISTSPPAASWMYDYGVIIMVGRGDLGPLDATAQAALEDWVTDGGFLLYTGYHPMESSCDMVDSLPSAFGLACADYSSYWSGAATNIVSHDVTDGVSTVYGMGGEHWTVSSPAQVVVDEGTWPVVAVAELGDGRVVGVSDEWFLYNAGSGSADISAGDNELLVDNIFSWLHW